MGMYTGLRFKGIVKEEFRNGFECIALNGEWEEFDDEVFKDFADFSRSRFIPLGILSYMPDEWETEPYDEYLNGTPTDGFDRAYDKSSGRWTFQCSLKNYNGTIEEFFNIVPYFIEEVEHAEVLHEEWRYSEKYELIDGMMVMTNDKFVDYRSDYDY